MSTTAHFSLAEYDRMIRSEVFDRRERRLELIRGKIREMAPIGSPHEMTVDRLAFWSLRNLPENGAWVRIQNSIGIPELASAPEPDVVWAVYRDYEDGRPSAASVLLLIEVAESTLEYDRSEKAELYAQAGIADYWIANVREHCIEVYRNPKGTEYRSAEVYRGDDETRPLAVPEMVLRPSMLWGVNPIGPARKP